MTVKLEFQLPVGSEQAVLSSPIRPIWAASLFLHTLVGMCSDVLLIIQSQPTEKKGTYYPSLIWKLKQLYLSYCCVSNLSMTRKEDGAPVKPERTKARVYSTVFSGFSIQ